MAEDPVDALFRVLPEDFVAERSAVVKALRAAGDREAATAVGKLRRPSLAEWALNQVAWDDPDAVEQLLDAVETAREAQAGAITGGAGDLRAANEERRRATADVVRRAEAALEQRGRAAGAQAAGIGDVLRRLGTSPALAEQLRTGRLGSAPAAEEDPFGGFEPAARAPGPRPRSGKATRQAAPPAEPPDDELARRRRERAVANAERALDKARQALERAQRRQADAATAVEDLQARLERAQQAHERADAELTACTDAVEQAEEQLRAAGAT